MSPLNLLTAAGCSTPVRERLKLSFKTYVSTTTAATAAARSRVFQIPFELAYRRHLVVGLHA